MTGVDQAAATGLGHRFILVRTMPASVSAAITLAEMIAFGEHDETVLVEIKIHSFFQRLVHKVNVNDKTTN
jgi:hypothetical protein